MLNLLTPTVSMQPLIAVSSSAAELVQKIPFLSFITNSAVVALVVLGLIFWFSSKATRNMTLVPHKAQNFFEFIVEFLYGQVEGIIGAKQTKLAFPLLGTLFIYILVANWFGLLPGVGTIGWGPGTGVMSISEAHNPLLRPPTADLNATLGLAVSAFIVWFYLTIKELGVWGFIVHTFGPKGGLKGAMGFIVALVFLFVGVIEIVSILFRPVTLSIRLFGNIFAGENVLHAMGGLGGDSILLQTALQLPFYFMELLVGLLQAIVFTLLCSVYIQLSTTHDDHGDEHGAH